MMKTVHMRMHVCIQIIFSSCFLSPYLFRFLPLQDRYCFSKPVGQGYWFELKFLGISTNKWWQHWWLRYHSKESSGDASYDHDGITTKKFQRSELLLEKMKEKQAAWLRVCLWNCLDIGDEEMTGDRNPKICLQSVFVHAQQYFWLEYYDNSYLN